ncbi:hypothetical protein AMEX_G15481 [Astyanax mexicanus]|uniref:Uncharacterized protein n=1 Tax=Astyanax mexicanus TaxID=7994 RepID=A0A8T2LL75_ASTMX|nr:hypothetical protein AMEX_G15481 [Astyanax mexicanus]
MAWSYTLTVGQELYILNQGKASPSKTRRKYDFRLLSPNTGTNGNTIHLHGRVIAGSGKHPLFTEPNRLIACGKQCVLSPRPYRCTSMLNKAESERSMNAEEIEREPISTHRSLDDQRFCSGRLETLEVKKRVHSCLGRRTARLISIRRPSTAPACTLQTRESEVIQQRPETPSCRVVWRAREGEHGHPDSPDSTSREIPVLHLYLPSYQLPKMEQEITQDKDLRSEINMGLDTETDKQLNNMSDTIQNDFKERKEEEENMIQGRSESKEGIETGNSTKNAGSNSEQNEETEITEEKEGSGILFEDNGWPNSTDDSLLQDVTQGEEKHNKKDELTEDKRQQEVTQGDIIKGEENKQHDIGEDIRHNDYTEDVKQLDITKEHDQEHSTAGENRLQGCSENNGSDKVADDIEGINKMAPDLEILQSTSDHKDLIKTQTSMENLNDLKEHQQVLEKREKAPPSKLKSGRAHVTTSCSLGQSSETNSLRRITHPAPVISFPCLYTHTYSSPLPHTLPSFYGTHFGYRLRTLHTPQPHRAKTWTTSISSDKRLIKTVKELPQSKETKGNHHVSTMETRGTTGPHPKIMSSEWGAPPCKTKTTKTFVWGPWGPQETKSVCELHTQANRCDGGAV